jgi:dihydrofolate reductase
MMRPGTLGGLTTKPKGGDPMATRRVIVQELVSVDGFVAGPSGELDFFEAVSDYSEVDAGQCPMGGPFEPARVLKAGLVDEIQLRVIPIMVGHSRTLLTQDTGRQDLTLLEAKPYASGIVSLSYAVTRR